LRSQLRIEFIKLETKDHFVNGIEMQGSIAIYPGEKLKKRYFVNRDLIVKCQKFRGQIENNHFNQENDVISKTIHHLLPQEPFQ
jgi:hypothetical protein